MYPACDTKNFRMNLPQSTYAVDLQMSDKSNLFRSLVPAVGDWVVYGVSM